MCVCVRAYVRACVRACVCASLLLLGGLFCCTVELSLLLSLLLYWFKRTPVDQILFLCNHASSKLVTSNHGQARFWDLFGPDEPLGSFPLTQNPEEQVVALSTDRENHVLVAGDTAGLIAVFDMKDYCMVTGKVSTTTTTAKVLPSTITTPTMCSGTVQTGTYICVCMRICTCLTMHVSPAMCSAMLEQHTARPNAQTYSVYTAICLCLLALCARLLRSPKAHAV